jgi:hypothetical protein
MFSKHIESRFLARAKHGTGTLRSDMLKVDEELYWALHSSYITKAACQFFGHTPQLKGCVGAAHQPHVSVADRQAGSKGRHAAACSSRRSAIYGTSVRAKSRWANMCTHQRVLSACSWRTIRPSGPARVALWALAALGNSAKGSWSLLPRPPLPCPQPRRVDDQARTSGSVDCSAAHGRGSHLWGHVLKCHPAPAQAARWGWLLRRPC